MLRGLLVLILFSLAGEALSRVFALPVPGSVLGMVLLALALRVGWVALDTVRASADALLKVLPFLFVPAGVGVMAYTDLLRAQWLPVIVASVVSTLVVFVTVGVLQQRLERP